MLAFVVSGTARAIPSPDVVVSLFASAAQVLGLATVVLGRWFFSAESRAGGKRRGGDHRTAFFVSAGLLAASLLGWGMFYLHVEDAKAQRLHTNLVRTSVENGKLVGDVNLKTLSYSAQQKREDGFQTEQLAQWIETGLTEPMLDIREDEEVEMGAIQGAVHMRYPDLLAHPEQYLQPGQSAILLCFNGNRSSETADALRPKGYSCRFMIGGYEKWNAEGRPLAMRPNVARKDLREVPDYVNKEVLLDTVQVERLVNDENVLFVDVRYPGEFEMQGHLPGAVNLPFRSLVSSDLDAALRALPKRPIVAPCYDKRGSFYGLLIGLRLTRLGYDYRGRYTTPEEYFVPSKEKAHVLAWETEKAGKSLLTAVAEPMKASLTWLNERTGSLAAAIVLLVIALRLLLFPITWKSERDRLAQANLAPELADIKARYAGDGRGVSRATMALLKQHKIRPMVNLLGASAMMVTFLVFFSVVQSASAPSEEGLLWMPKLSQPDPMRALPVVIGLLLIAQLALSARKHSLVRGLIWVAAAALLFVLAMNLTAGVNLYLTVSLALIVVHTAAARALLDRREEKRTARLVRRYAGAAVVPLAHAHLAPGCGKKAARLAELSAAKLPVPSGFVVTAQAVEHLRANGAWRVSDLKQIKAAHARLGCAKVAVRSSGVNEDGAEQSYAGVFDSVLEVTPAQLEEALAKVAHSFGSARANAYSKDAKGERAGIVVQAMVPAEYAGVLFTEHPGESGAMLVELVPGLGENLVSGRAQPTSHRYGRISKRLLDPTQPAVALEPLIELGRQVEELFGKPQDIEWAVVNGTFQLLQARDITCLSRGGDDGRSLREDERARLLALMQGAEAEEAALVQNELCELLPTPTPYSLALMDSLWAHGGSTDLACRALSIPYDVHPDSSPFVVSAFGALYVDKLEEGRRLARGPGVIASFKLARSADALERSFRDEFLPGFLRSARLRDAIDLSRLTVPELVELCAETRKGFVGDVYVQAETINVAADFYFKAAMRQLEKDGLDPTEHLSHIPTTVVQEAMQLLGEVGHGRAPLSDFLELYGHRAPLDYEIAGRRYREDPMHVELLAKRAAQADQRPHSSQPIPLEKKVLELAVERARRFSALKEEAKHHALREFAFLRSILVELGRRTGLGEGIFQLLPSEVERFGSASFGQREAHTAVRLRLDRAEALSEVKLSSTITPLSLETLDSETGQLLIPSPVQSRLNGLRVSGTGDVCGRARVLREAGEIETFQAGEILVARFTDPDWTPIFPMARGIITEVGGWLSHAAILAREHGLTAIVGARGALDSLATGDLVRLNADGTIELFFERRAEWRHRLSVEVTMRRESGTQTARLGDVSEHGALVLTDRGSMMLGETVTLDTGGVTWHGTVVRNGSPGAYGVAFASSIAADVQKLVQPRGGVIAAEPQA